MAKSAIVRLQLDPAAKQMLDRLCGQRGMTQVAVMSRLVSWLGTQDEVVQASVLGLMSEPNLRELAKAMMARRAAGDGVATAGAVAGRRG